MPNARLTTITAGWLWLAVAYVLPAVIGGGVLFIFFLAGCQDVAHAMAPSLSSICETGGAGDALRVGSVITLLGCWGFGLALSITAAVRNRHAPQGWALLSTIAVATAVALSVSSTRWATLGTFSLFGSAIAACVCALVVGPVAAAAVAQLTRRPQAPPP